MNVRAGIRTKETWPTRGYFKSRLRGGKEGIVRIAIYVVLFLLVCQSFFLLFHEINILRQFSELLKRTRVEMDEAARQRTLAGRKQLLELQQKHSFLLSLERQLQYSGLKVRFPKLTVEWWIAGNVVAAAGIFLVLLLLLGLWPAFVSVVAIAVGEGILLRALRAANLRRVNDNLIKFLDFLGNYSVTAAEATSVFSQVSRYMEEPLGSVLDVCCHEAQTTGDAGLALLSMAEKIEHPKFKELVRNMEVSIRYCADFSALVNSSRRSVREYLKVSRERKGMLREATVNMLLLLGMSAIVLMTVGHLTDRSMWELLWGTLPGKVGCGILLGIFGLFLGQLHRAQC